MKTLNLFIIFISFVLFTDGSTVDPNIRDGGRESMNSLFDALIKGDLTKAKSYASWEVLDKIDVYSQYEEVFSGKARLVDYKILGIRSFVCVDDMESSNYPTSLFILKYKLSYHETDTYGLVIWIYRDNRWQFVSFPTKMLDDFPFQYTTN